MAEWNQLPQAARDACTEALRRECDRRWEGMLGRSKGERLPDRSDDPVFQVPPATYVERLTGRTPGTRGMMRCPLHANGEERTASFQVYGAGRGWHCHGCHRGGTVIDLAAELWSLEPRGGGYIEIRRRLAALLLPQEAA